MSDIRDKIKKIIKEHDWYEDGASGVDLVIDEKEIVAALEEIIKEEVEKASLKSFNHGYENGTSNGLNELQELRIKDMEEIRDAWKTYTCDTSFIDAKIKKIREGKQ